MRRGLGSEHLLTERRRVLTAGAGLATLCGDILPCFRFHVSSVVLLWRVHHKTSVQPHRYVFPLGGGDGVLLQQHKKGGTRGHGELTPLLTLILSLLHVEAWLHPVPGAFSLVTLIPDAVNGSALTANPHNRQQVHVLDHSDAAEVTEPRTHGFWFLESFPSSGAIRLIFTLTCDCHVGLYH